MADADTMNNQAESTAVPLPAESREIAREMGPAIRLWILRMLVLCGGHFSFLEFRLFDQSHARILRELGVPPSIAPQDANLEIDHQSLFLALRELHQDAERTATEFPGEVCLGRNIRRLQSLVDLTEAECRVLSFVLALRSDSRLKEVSGSCEWRYGSATHAEIARVLNLSRCEVAETLAHRGHLVRSGLLEFRPDGSNDVYDFFELPSETFESLIVHEDVEPVELMRDTLSLLPPPSLTLDDFPHLENHLKLLLPYLGCVLSNQSTGANILIYGPPGTGKSQLSRLLAQHAGRELFEVGSGDAHSGKRSGGEGRLMCYRAAQTLLKKRRPIFLFEEAEDVFDGGSWFDRRSAAQSRKAWMNRTLEENPSPTLWVSNSISSMDSAFLRRFDMILEVGVPPLSHRARIVKTLAGDLLGNDAGEQVAESSKVSPAVISRAANVMRMIKDEIPADSAPEGFLRLVDSTLRAQGHGILPGGDYARQKIDFNPSFVNVDTSLDELLNGIRQTGSARICIYGPPGTGKTAYVNWIARQLDRTLMVRQASDLVSPFLGQTEQNLAEAFREARCDNAVLLIDEVDSFLRDRRHAVRSWEVSAVNELLQQMGEYQGIFAACTNLIESIDQAALRRFDLKLHFDYLKPDQARELFDSYSVLMELTTDKDDVDERVLRLNNLTPGDFAAVERRHRFSRLLTRQQLLAALVEECAIKNGGTKRPVGFI